MGGFFIVAELQKEQICMANNRAMRIIKLLKTKYSRLNMPKKN